MRRVCTLFFVAVLSVLSLAPPAVARADRAVVFEFDVLGENVEQQQWIGRAAQSSMSASVARAGLADVETPATVARNSDDARKLAAERGARFAVFGSAQLVNGEVRFVGTLLDVENNSTLASLKATGSTRDLFQMQDIMGGQVERKLGVIVAPKSQADNAPDASAPADPVAPVVPAVTAPSATPQAADSSLVLTPFQGSSLERSLGVKGSYYQRFIDTPVYERNYDSQYRNYSNYGWSRGLGLYPGYRSYYGGCGYGYRGYAGFYGNGAYGYGGYGYGGYGFGGGSNVIVVTNGNGNFNNNSGRR